jgi:hypothetical protein
MQTVLRALIALLLATAAARADWPQLGHDAGRSGATSADLHPPFTRKWYRLFADEGLQSGVQPVVAGHQLYIATLRGRLHAIDTDTGKDVWTNDGNGPALHTAAVAGGKVFVAIGDTLHAVNANDGTKAWSFKTPLTIWNAPAVQDGVVYFGSRDGYLHALDAPRGRERWKASVGAPILQSPAVDAKNGRIVVGAEDMCAYAFDLGSGRQLWRSDKLPGVSFRGYHPVVAPDGSVLITTTPAAGGDAMQAVLLDMAKEVFGQFSSWRIKSEDEKRRIRAENFERMKDPATYEKQLDYLRKRLTETPALQTFFVLDGETGKQRFVAPIVYAESMNGPTSPPVVTPEGKVIVKYGALLRSRYEHYSPFLNVGYLDTATGHITPVMDQSRTYGWYDSLLLVHDEQSQLVLAGRTLINTHQDNVNAMDLRSLKGDPKPWALNVHEVPPGVGTSLYLHLLHGRPLPIGWEWLPRGTAVYGGGSAIDTPVVVDGDSFYFLPTHEISAGVALIAYRMRDRGDSDQKPGPEAILRETATPDDLVKIGKAGWDWDTLAAERLKGTLAALPDIVPGTRQRPLDEEAKVAVAKIPDDQIHALILGSDEAPKHDTRPSAYREPLGRAVEELISREWRPLLFPAAKAPAESYRLFTDPTETLYTLALAYPHLSDDLKGKVRRHVAALRQGGRALAGPLGHDSYELAAGESRSAYDEPPASLLKMGRPLTGPAATRLYPYYLWGRVTGDSSDLRREWSAICRRFDAPARGPAPDLGNDRLSGLIALARLSREFDDEAAARKSLDRATAAVRERLVYELAHTEGGLITTFGQRSLVGRWHLLSPDLGRILRTFAEPIHRHLMANYVDHHRPAWYVAWNVELLWRNEAPFSFPDMSADIFAARALVLKEPADQLARYLDIPWCRADEYYVQKLALLCARASE